MFKKIVKLNKINTINNCTKFNCKNFESKSKIYIPTTHEFKGIDGDSKDKNIYQKITGDNKIDGEIRKFPISVNVLNKILCTSNPKSLLLIDFLFYFFFLIKVDFSRRYFSRI